MTDGSCEGGDGDLFWHFEQQRRFLFDLRGLAVNPEESVAADQHQAWNLKVLAQQQDIERLKARVAELQDQNGALRRDFDVVTRERDSWKSGILRTRLNEEFKGLVENLNADDRRFLRARRGTPMPDFERSLRQQMELMDTPLERLSHEGPSATAEDGLPTAMQTYPRPPGPGAL